MHNGLVTVNGTKMGKSLGNFTTLPDLFKTYAPMVVRYFILQFHYRSQVDFSDDGLKLADKQFNKLKESVLELRSKSTEISSELTNEELKSMYNAFKEAMDEDFNTPLAMVEINKLPKVIANAINANNSSIYAEINYIIKNLAEDVLGLDFGGVIEKKVEEIPAEVTSLAKKRWECKRNKDYAQADEIRKQISDLGYDILDSKEGYQITKRTEEK
jgi:cysteinyl-tRNA synthetase